MGKVAGAVAGAATGGLIGGSLMGGGGALTGANIGGLWGGLSSSSGATRGPGGAPIPAPPKYQSPLIKEDGQYFLPESMTMQSPILSDLTEQAQSTALSPWGKLQVERAGQEALGAGAAARQSLAMRGGLGGGAAERLAGKMGEDVLLARQRARGADIIQKQEMLPKLAQMEGAQQQFNIRNILEAQQQQEQAKFNAYDAMMRAWAGQQQGAAIREAGKPQGVISKVFGGIF